MVKNFHHLNLPFADSTAHLIFVTSHDVFASNGKCCFSPFPPKYGDSDLKPTDLVTSNEVLKPLSKTKMSSSFNQFSNQL